MSVSYFPQKPINKQTTFQLLGTNFVPDYSAENATEKYFPIKSPTGTYMWFGFDENDILTSLTRFGHNNETEFVNALTNEVFLISEFELNGEDEYDI